MGKRKGCKILFFILLLLVPCLMAATFGPWVGLREQATTPTVSSNGVKLYVDSSNDLYSLHENGTSYQLNTYDPNTGLTDPTSIGTLTLGSGSITDSSGAISFGNENLSTTGSMTMASSYLDGYMYRSSTDNNTAYYFRDDRYTLYTGSLTMIDAYETSQDYLYLGYDGASDIDVSIGANAAVFVEGSSGDTTFSGNVVLGDPNNGYSLTSHDAGTLVMYDDGDDTSVTIGPVTDGTTTLGITGGLDVSGNVDAGTMTLASGSITDSGGAISFGDENVTILGTLTLGADDDISSITIHDAGTIVMYDDSDDTSITIGPVGDGTTTLGITASLDVSGQVDAGTLTINSGSITDSSGAISFGDENISGTGAYDLGGAASLEIPNANADVTANAGGELFYDESEDQYVGYDSQSGELVAEEFAFSPIKHLSFVLDPGSWYDYNSTIFIMTVGDDAPSGIIIDEWKCSCNVDPDVEIDADLRYADAYIGLASAADIDEIDTANGVSSEDTDSNINSGNAVANGKVIYIGFDADPEGTCTQMIFEIWYHAID